MYMLNIYTYVNKETKHGNTLQRCVYIASDGGRVCRPLLIADRGVSRIKEHHMKELKVITFLHLIPLVMVLSSFQFSLPVGWCPEL